VTEEMIMYLGGAIGYWQGDVLKLVDDAAALQPTMFCGVPRVFDRIYGRVMGQVNAGGGLKKMLFDWGYSRKLHYLKQGKKQDEVGRGCGVGWGLALVKGAGAAGHAQPVATACGHTCQARQPGSSCPLLSCTRPARACPRRRPLGRPWPRPTHPPTPPPQASPFFDKLVFSKVKARLGGRVRILVSGGAPLAPHVEEFLKVAFCCPVVQVRTAGHRRRPGPARTRLARPQTAPLRCTAPCRTLLRPRPRTPAPPASHRRAALAARARAPQGYGLTETCASSVIAKPDEWFHNTSVGIPTPCTELRCTGGGVGVAAPGAGSAPADGPRRQPLPACPHKHNPARPRTARAGRRGSAPSCLTSPAAPPVRASPGAGSSRCRT
jgi:hypothetical protein